jgi:hypothetical protein
MCPHIPVYYRVQFPCPDLKVFHDGMYVCMYVCMSTIQYMHKHTRTHTRKHIRIPLPERGRSNVCACVCVHVSVCLSVCMYVCMSAIEYMHKHRQRHTHTHKHIRIALSERGREPGEEDVAEKIGTLLLASEMPVPIPRSRTVSIQWSSEVKPYQSYTPGIHAFPSPIGRERCWSPYCKSSK